MDSLWEIFSFHQIQDYDHHQELLQIPSSTTPCQLPQQELTNCETSLAKNDTNKKKRSRRLSGVPDTTNGGMNIRDQNKLIKRIAHRDFERQRRQEMANLCGSLRSHLPLEYIKGKRSVSDHLQQALSYIQHLKNNMKELEKRRDKLKILDHYSGDSKVDSGSVHKYNLADYVKVNPCEDGVEILISDEFWKERLPLSRVLEELVKRKLNVVTCVSTKVDETFIHKIHAEVTDVLCMDVSPLEQKLAEILNLPKEKLVQ